MLDAGIMSRLRVDAPQFFPHLGKFVEARPIWTRNGAYPLHALTLVGTHGAGDVVVKASRVHAKNDEGRTEDRNLRRFAAIGAAPDLRMPRPLAYYEHERIVVREFAAGVPLNVLLHPARLATPAGWRRAGTAIARAGRWLATWQFSMGDSQSEPFPATPHSWAYRNARETWILDGEPAPPFPADPLMDEIDESVQSTVRSGRFRQLVHTAAWHGDFAPANVLADNDAVSVIDAVGWMRHPIYVDLGRMLAGIAVCVAVRGGRVAGIRTLQRALLEAYAQAVPVPLEMELARQYYLASLLDYATAHRQFALGRSGKLRIAVSKWVSHTYARLQRTYLRSEWA